MAVQIRARGICVRMGETVQNTLKRGGTEGRGHKDFKKEGGGASWVSRGGVGALIIKRG